MDVRSIRVAAVRRCLQGEPITRVCRSLGKSRRWLYYWLERYSPSNRRWSATRSRAPHRRPGKTPLPIEKLVCKVRRQLEAHKYAQRGAVAIQWELKRLGASGVPNPWTIYRILRRNDLSTKRRYQPRGTPYPAIRPTKGNILHQLDLVGPRYLHGGIRFYGLHVMDAFTNAVALERISGKQDRSIVQALLEAWRRLGLPRFLQMDNELSFRGSNRYPRSFGLLLRTCLQLGIEAIFIPDGEPWRNGIVEHFNDVYDKVFLRRHRFRDLPDLDTHTREFETFHNENHRYAKLKQRTPSSVHPRRRRRVPARLSVDTVFQRPWKDGRISFIRLTDRSGSVHFFSERFTVDQTLVHEYVTGTIHPKVGVLLLSHQGKTIKTVPYKVSKTRIKL